ncbi:MAG TPA: HlyD family secretion protein [Pseudolabrys sp.]|nr:HlyD family secretion protein [Pseudolabrys sp.]
MALREQKGLPVEAEGPSKRKEAPGLVPQNEQRTDAERAPQDEESDLAVEQKSGGGRPSRLSVIKRHPFVAALIVLLLIAVAIVGVLWWLHARQFVSTDDAFIDTRTVLISPAVAGSIVAVPVTDNQEVHAGTVLVKVDPRDYQVAVENAKAQLEQANASVANLLAQIAAQQANIDQAQKQATQAQAALQFSEQQYNRYQTLLKRGAGTEQQAQQATADLTQKRAAYAGAQAAVTAAQKQLAVLRTQQQSARAQVDAARASLHQAQINLQRTTIEAPEDGRVAKLTAAKGNYAQPGQALMSLVPDTVWVTANFKETALADMRIGQPVTITVDAYPDKTFHGHVASIQAGSGAAFSLLPPENATGNFVKVVQRVPVKIVFDHKPDVYLGPGMSVVPSVKVQ